MADWQLKTPVAFLVFNRPDTTGRVFEEIRKAKPPKLLVVADGPRPDRPGEAEKCAAARAVIERVDWECEVLQNYSDVNLGCARRPATGITWVFEQVEEAIILEDDCLPHPTFFRFCDELLEKYRDDERVMLISGTNILGEWKSNIQSYCFSYLGMTWGWASWRRAWRYFDFDIKLWSEPEIKDRIRDVLGDKKQYQRVKALFDRVYSRELKTVWDYQWVFARLSQSGLAIVPSVNLISNIGFTEEGTHTLAPSEGVSNLSLNSMTFPLREPYGVGVDRGYAERHNQKFMPKSLPQRIVGKINRIASGK